VHASNKRHVLTHREQDTLQHLWEIVKTCTVFFTFAVCTFATIILYLKEAFIVIVRNRKRRFLWCRKESLIETIKETKAVAIVA
jgi:hypothetical protein